MFGVVGVLPFGIRSLAAIDLAEVSAETWLLVVYIILIPTVASYWLSMWALQRARSSMVAAYIYIQPIVTVLIAPVLLGERLSPDALVAGVLIFGGLAMVTLARRERPVREAIRETRI